MKNSLIPSKPKFPVEKFGNFLPQVGEVFIVFEVANISFFPRNKKVIPSLRERGGGEGECRGGSRFGKRRNTLGRGVEWIQRLRGRRDNGRGFEFPIFASFLLLVFFHEPSTNKRYLL
jgi:hypothetical protein